MTAKPKRRWFQFSLKTLLVGLTLLCLGPGGYVAYEQNKARRQKWAVEAIEQLGGVVGYGRNTSARSAMLRQILGDDSFEGVESIDFWNPSRVTDADLKHLACLKRLTTLHLDNSQVTDDGLKHLARLKSLWSLYLNNSRVNDAGLKHLAGLESLSGLYLDNTQVTDSGLVHLTGLKDLKRLYVQRTQVTDAGVADLQKSLPNCRIHNR